MPRTLNLFAALLTLALPAIAQTHFCVGGDLDHLSPAEVTSCRAKMTEVREAVRRRGAPSGWHFLIVCDESSWHDVAALTGQATAALRNVDFHTDREQQVTFIRGSHVAEQDGTAARLLQAALEGVPGRFSQPGIGVTPAPIPKVERKRDVPTLQIADAHQPDVHTEDDTVSGQ